MDNYLPIVVTLNLPDTLVAEMIRHAHHDRVSLDQLLSDHLIVAMHQREMDDAAAERLTQGPSFIADFPTNDDPDEKETDAPPQPAPAGPAELHG